MSKKPKYHYYYMVRQRYLSFSSVEEDQLYGLDFVLDTMSIYDADCHARRLAEKAVPSSNYKAGVTLIGVEEAA